jgi:hypothetical protein
MKKILSLLLACMAAATIAVSEECDYSQPYGTYFCLDADCFIDIGAGYRNDNFKWTTLSHLPFPEETRTLHEKWKNIGMGIIEVNAQMLAREHWLFKFDFDYGWFDQIKQQTVYGFNFNRRAPFRVTSKTSGAVYDVSGAFGYEFDLSYFCLSFAPLIGWSYDYQFFKNHHYCERKREFRTNNQHRFTWNGPWIGFAATYWVCPVWQFYLDYAFHFAQFKAHFHDIFLEAHSGHSTGNQAYGNQATVATSYQFCEDWFLGFKFDYKDFWCDKATTSIRGIGEGARTHQKQIRWTSYYATVELGYMF